MFLSFSFIGTKNWIRKNLRFAPHQRALLVWDSFRGHLTDAVKDLLARRNVDVAFIPGGLTSVLQPLDKCIDKPFKAKLRMLYETWMVNGPFIVAYITFFFFSVTKHEICERLKTKRFPSVIPYKIYKVGQNNVLGLDLLWVHHRVNSLRYIAKAYKTMGGRHHQKYKDVKLISKYKAGVRIGCRIA